LPHDTLRRIARLESGGGRQFLAPADRSIGACALWSHDNLGGVGVMQITVPPPTDDQVWNWRANVAKGIGIFNEKVAAARAYPSHTRNSHGFKKLVQLFNSARHDKKHPAIPVDLPDFTSGTFDTDLKQLELDSIRGYNGWGGRDQFGFPSRVPSRSRRSRTPARSPRLCWRQSHGSPGTSSRFGKSPELR
jgi:hypothetical protein